MSLKTQINSDSLRARLTRGFAIAFATLVLPICIGFLWWTNYTTRAMQQSLIAEAAFIAKREWDELEPGNVQTQPVLDELRTNTHLAGVSVVLVDTSGKIVGVSAHPAPPFPLAADNGWLVLVQKTPQGTIIAGIDRRLSDRAQRDQSIRLLLLALGLIGAATGCAWILVGRTLQPIGALSAQADAATIDPLHLRLSPPSDDAEVRHLVATLNGLLERLRRDARSREAFYAAAAHELRTPLAVLSGTAEVALSRPRTEIEYRETIGELQKQIHRLIVLVEGILTLNRLEIQSDTEPSEPVDMIAVGLQIVSIFQATVAERGLQIDTTDWDGDGTVLVPPSHLQILLRNLIENAVKYTSKNGRIALSIDRCDNGQPCGMAIFNTCEPPDLPLESLFEPFARADISRTQSTGGNGLGLAICRRIADRHGWQIVLEAVENAIVARVRFTGKGVGGDNVQ